ncbi:hypothetical protein [Desulfosporosinus sp. SB140]|uniref:hypothetical protein n=1 Tax=Desulfosporosinus paludis TaxID=3115649 RepID=UPI00388F424A
METKQQFELLKTISIAVGVILLIFFPLFLDHFIFGNNIFSNINNGEWASFLGSYTGGILGGIATLFAVLISLNKGKTIQQESEIRENALIVYYDLFLGLSDLKKLYIHELNPNYMDIPSRMYFSNEWIKNVAIIANKLDSNVDIIYKLYGDLETLRDLTKDMSEFDFLGDSNDLNRTVYFSSAIKKLSNKVFSDSFLHKNLTSFTEFGDIELDIERDLDETYKNLIYDLSNLKSKYAN